jgi:hypothetical protein
MSIFPITPLVRDVQKLIAQTFEISEREAQEYAAYEAFINTEHRA